MSSEPFKKLYFIKMPNAKSKGTSSKHSKGRTLSGKGDYSYHAPGPVGAAGRRIGSAIGGMYGGNTGATIGEKIGGLAHYVGRIFGSGDYDVSAAPTTNSLFKGSGKLPYEANLSFGERSVRIKHKEYISDVLSASSVNSFSANNYQVNPGLAATFPWLSQIAPSYTSYKWHGLVVEFKSTSADSLNSTNTALGTVIMATDMNATTFTAAFLNKQEMLNYQGSVATKPSHSALMGIECDPRDIPMSKLYTRTGAVPAGSDIRMSDMCSFAIATQGFQAANVNVGELYVIYDIELFFPLDYIAGSLNHYARCGFGNGALLANQVTAVTTSGLIGKDSGLVTFSGNMLVDNYNGTSSAAAFITIADRSLLSAGQVYEFKWLVQGAATAALGAANVGSLAGTIVEGVSHRYINPSVSTTGSTSSLSYRITIVDPSLLSLPVGGKYTVATGYPQAAVLFALVNTGVSGATNTVPSSVAVTNLDISLIHPGEFAGV